MSGLFLFKYFIITLHAESSINLSITITPLDSKNAQLIQS